jgi:solute carrier family 41
MLTLLIVTIPVEIIFLSVIEALGWLHLPFGFVALSMIFFCCAVRHRLFYIRVYTQLPLSQKVSTSLILAKALTNFLWSKNLDPDMYALPIHSALMDLVGQLLLVVCFEIVQALGVKITGK